MSSRTRLLLRRSSQASASFTRPAVALTARCP
jgi:hypothetical protein